ncbi:penicillin-binding protein 2B [Gracilibacillus halophilus YIM-C55.5]|uniref:serine-type D-Ala-D-Ala carboxypeptidase n=1 Tax=Gracilibacillus halophilus YIM-C55.5 TaxID=1308866 RepID=N4WGE5_9BACI|nr:penicillin-binding protein [Gracilibacillus halophilus]ENH98334.1 penicillin-binding protein 2B [Gracilibacillus halophilus YIM-C55.5]
MKHKTTHVIPVLWIVIFSIAFLVITGRFLYIQVTGEVANVSVTELAKEQRTNSYQIPAERGTIFDRNGMALAQEHTVYRMYAILDESYTVNPSEPKHVTDIDQVVDQIASIIGMEPSEMREILEEGREEDRFQVEFGNKGRELSQETKDKIESLQIPGINFREEAIRFYPNGMFASHTIGLTDKKEGEITGLNGVESHLNDHLTGIDGSISYQRDSYNVKLLNPKEIVNQPEDGDDVYLTIDQKIQTLMEDAMSEMVEAYDPARMSAVVMDAKTGEILAMSNRPSYNPNDLGDVENWYNDVISTPFEPGSTMKIFTLASAIEEGVWNPDEFYESGRYKAGDNITTISDHNGGEGWGPITYLEGIQRSSNVAAAKLAYEKIGSDQFLEYLKAFDFGQKTGINLSGEEPGNILFDYPIEQITTAFGQGTTTTPIQLIKAASAVANDGKMMQPYVIEKTVDRETQETIDVHNPEVVSKPISSETAAQTRDILETVITAEEGTGHNVYNLKDYSVAGKTGTAEIPDPNSDGYMTGHGNNIFSFLGMAPADDPELMMYVAVKQPELELTELGSAPTSFIFKNVMENSLRYLNIEPDKEEVEPVELIEIPDWRGKQTKEVTKTFEEKGIHYTTVGDGENVKKVSVSEGTKVLPNKRVLILTDQPKMPDITGWSRNDVLMLRDFVDLDVEWLGDGYVTKQSIKAGSPIQSNDYLMVEFAEPNES